MRIARRAVIVLATSSLVVALTALVAEAKFIW